MKQTYRLYDTLSLPRRFMAALCFGGLVLSGCASVSSSATKSSKGGGYYQNDGPGSLSPSELERIADAVPRDEKIYPATTKPYNALGRRFVPMTERQPYKARGEISWYGKQYHERKTSTGETYDMYAMSAAHPTLPLPSYARVTNLKNGKSVVVRVNDRGPFLQGRIMDLSYVAAAKLGYVLQGTTEAEVEVILPGRAASDLPPIEELAQAPSQPSPAAFIPHAALAPEILPTSVQVVPPEGSVVNTAEANAPSAWLDRQHVRASEALQTGAFSQASQAELLISRLSATRADWPEPNINVIRLKDDDGRYKVWLTGFTSPAARKALQAQLKRQGMDSFNVAR